MLLYIIFLHSLYTVLLKSMKNVIFSAQIQMVKGEKKIKENVGRKQYY